MDAMAEAFQCRLGITPPPVGTNGTSALDIFSKERPNRLLVGMVNLGQSQSARSFLPLPIFVDLTHNLYCTDNKGFMLGLDRPTADLALGRPADPGLIGFNDAG